MKIKREYYILIIFLLLALILSSFIKPLMEGMENPTGLPPILVAALEANKK